MLRKHHTEPGPGIVAVMGACYALGTFADNFYKQAAVLMAAALQMTDVQSLATVLFSLPFVLFSAWAGWISDRVSKKYIVVAAKLLELLAMLAGGLMLFRENWTGILVVMFLMSSQSALFSPAINGSIPENFPVHRVPGVNALIKLASTAAILAGMALAGLVLDARPGRLSGLLSAWLSGAPGLAQLFSLQGEHYGRAMAALCLVAVSLIGLVTALLMPRRPSGLTPGPGGEDEPFPWTGPLDSLRHALACRKDAALFLALLADAWFYGISVVAVISVANLAAALGYSNTVAGLLSASLMIGVALGSLLAGRRSAESWRLLLVPSACGISLMLILVSLAPLFPVSSVAQLSWMSGCLFLCGLSGGIYLIPLESFIQVRPAASEKGKIIAVSNFMSFVAMALFGALFQPVSLLPPALTFVVFGLATLGFVFCFATKRLAHLEGRSLREAASSPLAWLLQGLLSLRYTVEEEGLDRLAAPCAEPERPGNGEICPPKPGILFLPNHPALIDPLLVYSRLAGLKPRPLADAGQMAGPLQRLAGRIVGVVTLPDLTEDHAGLRGNALAVARRRGAQQVLAAVERIAEALKRGENVLLYPAGRAYRTGREALGNNSAAARVLQAVPGARVILVRSTGLWGSEFSYALGAKPDFARSLWRGVLTILANGLFFTPRRRVRMHFAEAAEPSDLADELGRDNGKAIFNKRLEAFYNDGDDESPAEPVTRVPRFFWQRKE